jgi:3-hydroxyisobutyrate dehydrogenase-like beta-hydroxyacid dehydrogenase
MKNKGPVAVIGLGRMGCGMAVNLQKAGFDVRGFDKSDGAIETARENNVTVCASSREACDGADTVVLSLVDERTVDAALSGGVLEAVEGAEATIIDTTTISPAAVRRFARRAEEVGARYLDSPVTGGIGGAWNGALYFMVGGDRASFEACGDVYAAMAKRTVLVGETGAGSTAKMVNQLLMCAQFLGAAEALHYTRQSGVDFSKVLEAINPRLADNGLFKGVWSRTEKVSSGEEETVPAASDHISRLFAKDIACVLDAGVRLPGTEAVRHVLETAMNEGKGPFPYTFVDGLDHISRNEGPAR